MTNESGSRRNSPMIKTGKGTIMNDSKRKQVEIESGSHGDPQQIIMTGVLTEMDIFRAMMRKIAAKGGSACSPAQTAHRKRAMAKINAAKRAKKAAREAERLKDQGDGHG